MQTFASRLGVGRGSAPPSSRTHVSCSSSSLSFFFFFIHFLLLLFFSFFFFPFSKFGYPPPSSSRFKNEVKTRGNLCPFVLARAFTAGGGVFPSFSSLFFFFCFFSFPFSSFLPLNPGIHPLHYRGSKKRRNSSLRNAHYRGRRSAIKTHLQIYGQKKNRLTLKRFRNLTLYVNVSSTNSEQS